MFKEYKQLDDLSVLGRLDPYSLTYDQKHNALIAVNLIMIKREGKCKGHTCANRSTQMNYVPRDEASSPKLYLEAIMAILLINAHEEHGTVIFDVPGAYIHAKMPADKFTILKIERGFVDIMCAVNLELKADVLH